MVIKIKVIQGGVVSINANHIYLIREKIIFPRGHNLKKDSFVMKFRRGNKIIAIAVNNWLCQKLMRIYVILVVRLTQFKAIVFCNCGNRLIKEKPNANLANKSNVSYIKFVVLRKTTKINTIIV